VSAAIADIVAVRVPERSWRSEGRAVRVVWRRDLIRFADDPRMILTWMLQPLLFLFVLGPGLQSLSAGSTEGVDLTTFMFPGILCMALVFSAIFSAASLVWDRELGFMREMMVAPVSRWSIIAGKCLGGTTIAASQGLIVLALAGLVHVPYDPVLLLGVFGLELLIAFTVTAFGVMVAATIKRPQTFTSVVQMLVMPMIFLSGALSRLEPARLARRAQPPQPTDLRRRPAAPAGVRPPCHRRERPALPRSRRHLVGLARARVARGGDRACTGPGDVDDRHAPVLANGVTPGHSARVVRHRVGPRRSGTPEPSHVRRVVPGVQAWSSVECELMPH
jgi:ABC-2 type transport system permease protein